MINILCATDNNYAPYCGIMLTSLFESNKDKQFDVYVFLDGDMSDNNISKFRKLEGQYGNPIHLMKVDNELLKDCPINKLNNLGTHLYVTLPTYYRLLAADLLPEAVHKVIYLDCDIAVNGDISPMWEVDLEGKAIAGVVDCGYDSYNFEVLDYPESFGYINAGVAVYNLDYWRKNHLSATLFEYARENAKTLRYMDQDVVNGVLYDKKILLDERYNFQNVYFAKGNWEGYPDSFKKTLLEKCLQPIVIHYCGVMKPWNFKYYGGPYLSVWENYRKHSLWKVCRQHKPLTKFVKRLAKMYLTPKKWSRIIEDLWVITPDNRIIYE